MTCHDYTEPGVLSDPIPDPTPEQLGEIRDVYEIVTGKALNGVTARMLERYFGLLTVDLILEALERTGRYARRPCAEYAAAICRNWLRDGIRTMQDLTAADGTRKQAQRHSRAMRGDWWAKRGQEHSYTDADMADVYYDPTLDYPPQT